MLISFSMSCPFGKVLFHQHQGKWHLWFGAWNRRIDELTMATSSGVRDSWFLTFTSAPCSIYRKMQTHVKKMHQPPILTCATIKKNCDNLGNSDKRKFRTAHQECTKLCSSFLGCLMQWGESPAVDWVHCRTVFDQRRRNLCMLHKERKCNHQQKGNKYLPRVLTNITRQYSSVATLCVQQACSLPLTANTWNSILFGTVN